MPVAREDRTLAARVVREVALEGVSAGSGLLRVGDALLAVRDDAFRVSWIALPSLRVRPLVLAGDGAPLAKSTKPDFECAVRDLGGEIHVLGSGSTARRCAVARLDLDLDAGRVTLAERPALYDAVARALALDARANVEGAVVEDGVLRLFHRGAGAEPSGAVDLPLGVLDGAEPVALRARRIDLGRLDGVRLGFTDAAREAGVTLFVAAAEDAADAIADGPVTGSVVGVLESDRVRWARLASADGSPWRAKVEGIAVDADLRGAWAITDSDDASASAVLCRIELAGFDEPA